MMGAEPGRPNELSPITRIVANDFHIRAHAIVRTWLRGDVEDLVALVGDDADELLPTRDAVRLCYHGVSPPAGFLAYSPDRS